MTTDVPFKLDIRQQAPLNTWIAISSDGERIVAMGPSAAEVSRRCAELGASDGSLFKTPPAWGPRAL